MARFASPIKHLPITDDLCGWWKALPEPEPARQLEGNHSVDCAIIGAGFTGLAAATQLASLRPDWRIAVVEALRVGQGPSGRNSGFVVDLGHYQPALGPEGNKALLNLSRRGLDALQASVEAHDIACDWTPGRRLHVAVNARGLRCLEHFREGLDALGEPYKTLDGAQVEAVTGSAYYSRAIKVDSGALVQPAALIRGLAEHLPDNVQLYESSPVQNIQPGPPHTLKTAHGQLESPRLLLATNGFTPWLGPERGRIIPLLTFASLTRPLTASEQSALGGDAQWGAVPEERMGSTLRRTADGRILVRNGVHFASNPSTEVSKLAHFGALHRKSFEARFPGLRDVPFETTWCGVLGMTINNGTRFGEVQDGVFIAAAHNGVGMALGTVAGMLIAHRMTGDRGPLDEAMASLPAPIFIPPGPWLRAGIHAYTGVLQRLAGSER